MTPIEEKDPIVMVEEFHRLIGAKIGGSPDIIDPELFSFRYQFMKEENEEYLEANYHDVLVDILDALVDMQYFLLGTVINHGLQDVFWQAFNEVHRSNMTKTANGNGKAVKGENYSPPDLLSLLMEDEN